MTTLPLRTVIRPVSLLLATVITAGDSRSMPALQTQSGPKAVNVKFVPHDGKVLISYDLLGDPGETYRVGVILKKESDSTRSYKPKLISGAVGEGVLPGRDREILWDLSKEIPAGLEGSDYYFVITAEEEGGFPWWAGAAIVSAGILGVLMLSSGGGDGGGSPSLPPPPGRP